MSNIKSVCVYCGSSTGNSSIYKETAEHLGTLLAQNNIQLVFGGGRVGLMGVVSSACLKAGGKVVGVMTSFLKEYEGAQDNLTHLHIVESMYERKQMMFQFAEAFIILPGGFGTLDEAFEVLTLKQVGLHTKQIVFFNINGYWDPLLETTFGKLVSENFVREGDRKLFKVVNSLEEIIPAINEKSPLHQHVVSKWG